MREIKFKKADNVKVICEVASYIDSLDENKRYCLTIKEEKKKRSLDANAYCWVLIDKIAERLHESKTAIYRGYIKEIGGNSKTVCVINDAVNDLCEIWQSRGLGWQTDTMRSKIKGCTNVILYYGSSLYDTKQMSRLIDLVVQDCKALGIETMTPQELDRLCEEWG